MSLTKEDFGPREGECDEVPDAQCEQCGGPVVYEGRIGDEEHGRCLKCGKLQVLVEETDD